jgi:hypothetical protein
MVDREDRDQARAVLKQMEAGALADEAKQAAHGVRHLTAGPATLNPPAPQRSCCGMLRTSAPW